MQTVTIYAVPPPSSLLLPCLYDLPDRSYYSSLTGDTNKRNWKEGLTYYMG
jgi:hypothetical protein